MEIQMRTNNVNEEFTENVYIEISKNSHVKYEYDHSKNALVCDRILHTPLKYMFNYGFVPNTLSEDGDPIDVVVIMDEELVPGCLINCKILGFLETSDDKGCDPKLIMCPSLKIDPTYKDVNDISNLSEMTLEKIRYFFSHYKDLEYKNVTIGSFKDKLDAIQVLIKSKESFLKKNNTTHKMLV